MDCNHIRFMILRLLRHYVKSNSFIQSSNAISRWQLQPSWHEPTHLGTFRTELHQVHKCIAQVGIPAEIHGKIHEIVELTEALFVQQGKEHVAGVVVGQVAQHHLKNSQEVSRWSASCAQKILHICQGTVVRCTLPDSSSFAALPAFTCDTHRLRKLQKTSRLKEEYLTFSRIGLFTLSVGC